MYLRIAARNAACKFGQHLQTTPFLFFQNGKLRKTADNSKFALASCQMVTGKFCEFLYQVITSAKLSSKFNSNCEYTEQFMCFNVKVL